MGENDDGERIARLEEQMKAMQADIAAAKRMVYGAVAMIVAVIWNKLAAFLGMGPQ